MGKNRDKRFQSNLLDEAPVTAESHIDSEATAKEPEIAETEKVVNEDHVVEAPAVQKKPEYGFYEETEPRIYGRVNSKCKKLNVRSAASPNAGVVAIINSGKEVRILKKESTDSFYKISLDTGVSGFAMKEFIDEV